LKRNGDTLGGRESADRDTLVIKNTIPNVSAVLMRRTDLSGIERRLVALKNRRLVVMRTFRGGDIACSRA
jgi:hypothetical protein